MIQSHKLYPLSHNDVPRLLGSTDFWAEKRNLVIWSCKQDCNYTSTTLIIDLASHYGALMTMTDKSWFYNILVGWCNSFFHTFSFSFLKASPSSYKIINFPLASHVLFYIIQGWISWVFNPNHLYFLSLFWGPMLILLWNHKCFIKCISYKSQAQLLINVG